MLIAIQGILKDVQVGTNEILLQIEHKENQQTYPILLNKLKTDKPSEFLNKMKIGNEICADLWLHFGMIVNEMNTPLFRSETDYVVSKVEIKTVREIWERFL